MHNTLLPLIVAAFVSFAVFPAQNVSPGFTDNNIQPKLSTKNSEQNVESVDHLISSNTETENLVTEHGLIFEKASAYRSQDSSFTDRIQLYDLSGKAQAIQFRIQLNKTDDDSTFLIFQNIEKGSDIIDSNWVLIYNVFKGSIYPNGASKDEVYVLLYNVNQNGGLDPGNYEDLIKVKYRVAEIPDLQDSVKSSMKISNAAASTNQGFPIDITPSRDEFKIIVRKFVPVIIKTGLVFLADTVYRLEDDSYIDVMQLRGLTEKMQAMQFRLKVNKAIDDNVILTFQSLQKGSDITSSNWVLNYNIFRGPLTGNGASVDEIFVLLYNLQQNGGLNPGDYNDLFRVKYRVADLQALQDSLKSSITISNAEASTYQGFPINITPSRDELTVIALNRVGFWGDVNGDGCLDILDIIMVVDHIVGRDSLESDEFERADIAPWIPGDEIPNPDGFVNVQDLSLLQNIILTGVYPNGVEINGCSYTIINKVTGDITDKVTFYINEDGITAYSNFDIDIRGVQIEFGHVLDDPGNMLISTALGQGYFYRDVDTLRVLLYDRRGEKIIESGEHLLADMPFNISNPELITIEKLIVIDINREKMFEIQVEVIYGNPPILPVDFILFQNYPNPFNPVTTIEYTIPRKTNVKLVVYDLLGYEIATLVDEEKNRGLHSVSFNGLGIATGVYFYRMQAEGFVQTKKMMYLK